MVRARPRPFRMQSPEISYHNLIHAGLVYLGYFDSITLALHGYGISSSRSAGMLSGFQNENPSKTFRRIEAVGMHDRSLASPDPRLTPSNP
jgi:hypothetical protein